MSSYLECQDKFRFSGIFRSVYLLKRPEEHITDYRIETHLAGEAGILTLTNESAVPIRFMLEGEDAVAVPGESTSLTLKHVRPWRPEEPTLYSLTLYASGEKIPEEIGFREITIDGPVFKINGEAVKLKGVNRHDFNCRTGATVTLADMAEDVRLMKELNVNAVRTSHYPNCPEFYLLCDHVGIYVMDEADLEMHGACARDGRYDRSLWSEYAEDLLFAPGITDRHRALVERDKNRTCVILWSLGNESSFGRAFEEGARYIRTRDPGRPIHYEGLQEADPVYYYTDLVDVVSMMYPSLEKIRERVLENDKETRPFVMCEYSHSMGNSNGDLAAYWKMISQNDQMMGGFVWEWADHAILTDDGFRYGGDFGEELHDGNFCIDGLMTPDRRPKSGAIELKAVYGGKLDSEPKDVPLPKPVLSGKPVEIVCDDTTGEIVSLLVGGVEILRTPIRLNIMRYIDNDRPLIEHWIDRCRLPFCRPRILSAQMDRGSYRFEGVLAANSLMPAVYFTLTYSVSGSQLTVNTRYRLADYVEHFPRFGLEFGIDKKYQAFSYIGYGPTESYCDKHVACEYGYYESTARGNYEYNYVRPQESGSHYACRYLSVTDLFAVTAEKPFSFSVNPYTTRQLCETRHNDELTENGFVNICLDLAQRGIGSHSCGPELDGRCEIQREGEMVFTFSF